MSQPELRLGLYFNNTFSSFGISSSKGKVSEIYSLKKLFKPIMKAVFDASLCHIFSPFILVSRLLLNSTKKSVFKRTQSKIYSLTFFVAEAGRRKENKLFSFHSMSKQKVSHFKYTLAILRTNDEQRMKSFNVHCV